MDSKAESKTKSIRMELKRRRVQQSHKCFQDDENNSDESDEYFQNKRSKVLTLEDKTTKSKRLQDEGEILAESERYWEAIKYWNEAIELTPENPVLHEIKAQALLELDQVFPAVLSAENAVERDRTWAPALQTLGRAQLGLGEVQMVSQFQSEL